MKLWHDDVRPPPDEAWVWAKTNEEAKEVLSTGEVEFASLDHDLGMEGVTAEFGTEEWLDAAQAAHKNYSETGLDLVNWMLENNCVPRTVQIHSWNVVGAKSMLSRLLRYRDTMNPHVTVYVAPFTMKK